MGQCIFFVEKSITLYLWLSFIVWMEFSVFQLQRVYYTGVNKDERKFTISVSRMRRSCWHFACLRFSYSPLFHQFYVFIDSAPWYPVSGFLSHRVSFVSLSLSSEQKIWASKSKLFQDEAFRVSANGTIDLTYYMDTINLTYYYPHGLQVLPPLAIQHFCPLLFHCHYRQKKKYEPLRTKSKLF